MKKGFIFDLDGTIYLEDQLIEGAAETIQTLKKRGDKVVFLTNKSIATRSDYLEKLGRMGIDASLKEIVNPNYITAKYLQKKMQAGEFAFVIGEEALFKELSEEHIAMTDDYTKASYVVIGWDRQFTYDKLNAAYQAWRNKAEIIATNPDRTCPINGGQIPDCGAMIGALEGATGAPIDTIIGKPSRMMADFVVSDLLQLDPANCYMVGDRLETDIRMGNENGFHSVLVLTGITTEHMLNKAKDKPWMVLESINDIVHMSLFKDHNSIKKDCLKR
ncbi:HAD-IIA family hydrolase [Bacillus chungangensis]|uniref:Acid sugar phosphatase n=1 Tax=Bacillus chungangensis TaxID=587633 RepID=A0ABT9WPD5_9BACI|nr:HAD-IIA family hydrolase [Bacillus chungangensis]MDQ0175036.1 arabinose operon protein AraL [Bacillus chungangensis]